jgi:hypothetical protein
MRKLSGLLALIVGGFVALYCGVGSLFLLLGSDNPVDHLAGMVFIVLVFLGSRAAIFGIRLLSGKTVG